MIACTASASVPKVGGISADSSTPSRPLVPGADEHDAAALAERLGQDVGAEGDAIALALDGGEHLPVFGDHEIDDARTRAACRWRAWLG